MSGLFILGLRKKKGYNVTAVGLFLPQSHICVEQIYNASKIKLKKAYRFGLEYSKINKYILNVIRNY